MMNENDKKEEDNLLPFPHFRPCGVLPEYLDDPVADLLNEFKHMEMELELENALAAPVANATLSGPRVSAMEQLSLNLAQLNQQLQELGLAQQRIRFYLDEIEANLPED